MKMNPKDRFYEVKLQVEVTRRVLASSEEEALERVDSGDMIHEIKNYSLDEEWSATPIQGANKPTKRDYIDLIAEDIVRNCYSPMHWLQDKYEGIRKLNARLVKEGEEPYEPFIFNRMTDDFNKRLRAKN